MTEITVTDYETTEVQKTQYECDHCGVLNDEDEINVVLYHKGSTPSEYEDERHLCEDCIGLREALDAREKVSTLKERWKAIADTSINKFGLAGAFVFGTTVGGWSTFLAGVGEASGGTAIIINELGAAFFVTLLWTVGLGMMVGLYYE